MTGLIEDRLRAHFADRAARDVLPGPEADVAVERARQAGARSGGRAAPRNVRWLRRPRVLLAAAVVVAIAAAGALIATDDPARVTTDPSPAPTSPDQGPDPSTTPSTEPTTPSTSETTAPPPAGDRPTGPIVSLEGVLGTWSGSEWVPWDAGATPGDAGDGEYRIVRLDEPITSVVASGSASPMACAYYVPGVDIGLEYTDDLLDPAPIGVTGVDDPRPRPVEVLDPTASVYRDAAVEVVAGLGIADPAPQVSQVVRGDLDGDGSAEVVVVAERLSDPDGLIAGDGDYSVAFARRVVGGDVDTTVVASSIADPRPEMTPFVEVYRVAALADLNGDGRMEVVVNGRYYEGSMTYVHELRSDGTLPEVLSAGCGV